MGVIDLKTNYIYEVIFDIMADHYGMDNGISTDQLHAELLAEGFDISRNCIRNYVDYVRDVYKVPIWYFRSCGYFVVSNDYERKLVVESLNSHVNTLFDTLNYFVRLNIY